MNSETSYCWHTCLPGRDAPDVQDVIQEDTDTATVFRSIHTIVCCNIIQISILFAASDLIGRFSS